MESRAVVPAPTLSVARRRCPSRQPTVQVGCMAGGGHRTARRPSRQPERADGVLVTIAHDLNFRVKILAPIAEKIIGDFFIGSVANKTLRCMKHYVEARANPVTA